MAAGTAIIMSTSMISSSWSSPVAVEAKNIEQKKLTYHEIEDRFQHNTLDSISRKGIENSSQKTYKPEDEVKVIASMKDDALLESYIEEQKYSKKNIEVEEYLKTDDAKTQRKEMLEEQSDLERKLNKSKSIDNVQILNHFTTIVNGFSAKIKYKDLEALEENKEIADVSIMEERKLSEPVKPVTNYHVVSRQLEELQTEYTGKGTTIAIIDTGADITHEVFQADVPEPKVAFENVKSLVEEGVLHIPAADSEKVYKSTKIPFAYDYAEEDTDVCPDEDTVLCGNEHGTHVASIAGANETDSMSGAAKDAQLMIMKVFDDEGYIEDEEIEFSALEDAVVLGADVINMSIGEACGFSKAVTEVEQEIYDRINEAGISVAVSAGNDYDSSLCNALDDRTLAETPDNGVISASSSFDSCTSVASVAGGQVTRPYFKIQEKEIPYAEIILGQPKFDTLLEQPLQYCIVEGRGGKASYDDAYISDGENPLENLGEEEDIFEFLENYIMEPEEDETSYESIDVEGKVVLIHVSDYVSMTTQVTEAERQKAIGVIIISDDNVPLSCYMTKKVSIPVIGIKNTDGEYLIQQDEKTVEAVSGTGKFIDTDPFKPSEFSSIGVTPDLKLKPEIAAFGEGVYAALPFGNYGNMDGTSMSSPAIAGYCAIMKEYLENSPVFSELTVQQKNNLVIQLLMSTANPLKNQEDVFYAPRKLGSGLVDISAATHTKAYLYTDESMDMNQKPKLNLYDDPERTGVFRASFHLRNFGEEALTYQLSYQALKEDTCKEGELTFLTGTESNVNDKTQLSIRVDGEEITGEEIIAAPGEDLSIEVTFTLNEELKNEYDQEMKNGGYFEGYIQLESSQSSTLSIPYLGFYGDWTSAPLFDEADVFECNPYIQHPNYIRDDVGCFMGCNMFDEDFMEVLGGDHNPYFEKEFYENIKAPGYDKIAVSPNGDGWMDGNSTAMVTLLRGAKEMSYQLTDSQGKVVCEDSNHYYEKQSAYMMLGTIPYYGIDVTLGDYLKSNTVANNEKFTLTIKGSLDYDRHEQNNLCNQLTFPITVDTERPKAKGIKIQEEGGKHFLVLTASDNQYISYAGLYKVNVDETLTPLVGQTVNEGKRGKSSEIKLDLTELENNKVSLEECVLQVYDYALNHTVYSPEDTSANITNPVQLNQVQKLKAVKNNEKSIQISWNKVKNATHYQIYGYDKTNKKYVKVKTVKSNVLSAQIKAIGGKSLKVGTGYQFKVRAAAVGDKTTYGKFSGVLYTATCTKKPVLKLVTKKGVKKLQWNRESLATGYQVYRSSSKNGKYSLIKTYKSAKNNAYTSKKNGKKYYYKVRTYKTVKNVKIFSGFSNRVAYKR